MEADLARPPHPGYAGHCTELVTQENLVWRQGQGTQLPVAGSAQDGPKGCGDSPVENLIKASTETTPEL